MKELDRFKVNDCMMKRTIFFLLVIMCADIHAQNIAITHFTRADGDMSASDPRTSVKDVDGNMCAVLKLETKETGWTFDTGLTGIMETRYEEGLIWLYVPKNTRFLSVFNSRYSMLEEWALPMTLESGQSYTMKLTTIKTKEKSAAVKEKKTLERKAAYDDFSSNFLDLYMGYIPDELYVGINYSWIGRRVGPYLSLGISNEETMSMFGGMSLRLINPERSSLDLHLNGGIGAFNQNLAGEVSTRLAWRNDGVFGKWDFGVGCQFSNEIVVPTISFGLYLWGLPLVMSLIFICAG